MTLEMIFGLIDVLFLYDDHLTQKRCSLRAASSLGGAEMQIDIGITLSMLSIVYLEMVQT